MVGRPFPAAAAQEARGRTSGRASGRGVGSGRASGKEEGCGCDQLVS